MSILFPLSLVGGGSNINNFHLPIHSDPFYFQLECSFLNSEDFLLKHFSSWGTLCRWKPFHKFQFVIFFWHFVALVSENFFDSKKSFPKQILLYKIYINWSWNKNFGWKLLLVTSVSSAAKRKQHVAQGATVLLSKTKFEYDTSNLAFFHKICTKTLIWPKNADFVVKWFKADIEKDKFYLVSKTILFINSQRSQFWLIIGIA